MPGYTARRALIIRRRHSLAAEKLLGEHDDELAMMPLFLLMKLRPSPVCDKRLDVDARDEPACQLSRGDRRIFKGSAGLRHREARALVIPGRQIAP